MRATRPLFIRLTLLVLLLVCSASMWIYWKRVPGALHAANIRTGLLNAKPLTDLYPRWYGTRELVLHHRDPYGVEVSQGIQIAYYGRALNPSVPGDRLDQQRFAYPLYVIFLMLPTVPMEFDTVRVVMWWFLAAVAAAGVWLWLRFLRLQLSVIAGVAVFAVALTSLPMMQGLSLLQLGLVVAGLIAAAAACAANGRFFLAGTLLAMATIKPQMAVLPIVWFFMWAVGAWRQRKPVVWGFGAMLTALIVSSEFLLPGWLIRYPKALVAYSEYTNATAFLGTVLPSSWCWVVSIVAVLGVGAFCWKVRREPADSVWFAIALAFVLALTVTVVPTVNASFNQVLLLPVFLLGIRHWRELGRGSRLSRLAVYAIWGYVFLPWVLAFAVVVAQPGLRNGWYLAMWSAPLYFSFALPLAALGLLILLCRAVASNATGRLEGTGLAAGGAVQGGDSVQQSARA
jgi:Glycosyltransferase family 87